MSARRLRSSTLSRSTSSSLRIRARLSVRAWSSVAGLTGSRRFKSAWSSASCGPLVRVVLPLQAARLQARAERSLKVHRQWRDEPSRDGSPLTLLARGSRLPCGRFTFSSRRCLGGGRAALAGDGGFLRSLGTFRIRHAAQCSASVMVSKISSCRVRNPASRGHRQAVRAYRQRAGSLERRRATEPRTSSSRPRAALLCRYE